MKPERAGDLYALVCALICGLGNIPAKVGLKNISTELFNFYFFLFAFGISLLTLLNPKSRREIIATNLRSFLIIIGMSVLFSLGIYTFIHSLKLIEPATVSFLSRVEVIFTIVLAFIFLKERLKIIELIGGAVAILGVLLLKYETNLVISKAATLMIASAFFFTVAEILVKRFVNEIGTVRFVFIRNLFAVVFFFAIVHLRGKAFYIPDTTTLGMTFLAALLLPILGRLTYIKALQRINISRAALITQSTPLFTALFAFLILKTYPTLMEWLGGLLIIMGVVIVRMTGLKIISRPPKTVAKPPM